MSSISQRTNARASSEVEYSRIAEPKTLVTT